MKINTFSFHDKTRQWQLAQTDFKRLTLLVGASGVGKTQILRAIITLKEIVKGKSFNGIGWKIDFSTIKGNRFIWEGEFEEKDTALFDDDNEEILNKNPRIAFERIYKNAELLVNRDKDKIEYQKNETVKLSREKSILSHLEENFVQEIKEAMVKIQANDYTHSQKETLKINPFNANSLIKKFNTLKKIRQSALDTRTKLYLAYKTDEQTFNQIRERFTAIFPQVENLKIAPIAFDAEDIPDLLKDYPFIQVKEYGVERWVLQNRISSGMFRALLHISELYLAAEGTLFLIDEFENSLGINCIDELTEDILQTGRNLQFILTSHHPYIINTISFQYWKLVTRSQGVVKTHDASEFNIGKSRHDAFMQLIQLDAYQTGSEIA